MLGQVQSFQSPQLEQTYAAERRASLADVDMKSAGLFVLLWAHDVIRFCTFLGRTSIGSLLQATVWLVTVGLKPVYVRWLVGRDFYLQYRAWILAFTKTVFAAHPPGENLHLAALAASTAAAHAGPPGALRVLWTLACGVRLPFMLVTGLGWPDFLHNIPLQLALVGRAVRDKQAQCATSYFQDPQVQALLRGLAGRLTSLLSACLRLGAGIKGQQASFPAELDPCNALGTWAAVCFGFLLTTMALATSESRARAKFARRHSSHLAPRERELWLDSGASSSGWWASWAATVGLLGFACLLVWQVLLSLLSWSHAKHITL